MTNSKELFGELVNKILLPESKDELESMVYLILEKQLGLSRSDVLKERELEIVDRIVLDGILLRVNAHEPVQYILGEAWFYGRKFKVDPSVLIPRPETELIVDEILKSRPNPKTMKVVMADIGTGSGCLAITLAKELPHAKIYATDVSPAALMTAVENAERNTASVEFIRNNILTDPLPLQSVDWLVSNPPYVTMAERNEMKKNVTAYEPAEALFVPDGNPLIFYHAIARQGNKVLRPGGKVVVEINEKFGKEVAAVFSKQGYELVEISKDFSGKDRMVSAVWSGVHLVEI